MKRIDAVHGIVMNNPASMFNFFGWPSIARLPDGTLAAVASGFRLAHTCPFGKSVISYSRDGGATWTRPAIVIDTPLDDRDSGIACIGGKRVIVTSFNNRIKNQRSWANDCYDTKTEMGKLGKTFKLAYCDLIDHVGVEEKYYGAVYTISEDGGYTFGEIKKLSTPIASIHGPCLAPDGSVYLIGYATELGGGGSSIQCWKMRPDDTFEYLTDIPRAEEDDGTYGYYEPHATVLPDGTIIVMIRVHLSAARGTATFCSRSTDNGKTFSPPVNTGAKGIPCHVLCHSSGILIGAYSWREPPYGQRVMISRDNGKTWDTDYILRDDGPCDDLGYPCSAELADGSVITVYYQAEPGETELPKVSVDLHLESMDLPIEKAKNPIIMYSKWSVDGLLEK